MKRVMATDAIILEALKLMETDPYADIGNWNVDATPYHPNARLSEQKMLNEVDHRELRQLGLGGHN
jgi:hypothetical protein